MSRVLNCTVIYPSSGNAIRRSMNWITIWRLRLEKLKFWKKNIEQLAPDDCNDAGITLNDSLDMNDPHIREQREISIICKRKTQECVEKNKVKHTSDKNIHMKFLLIWDLNSNSK